MKAVKTTPATIDEYIAGFPAEVQAVLEKVRLTIRKAAPDAQEKISYQIPTFHLNGNLVHFGAWKKHIGFYPTSSATVNFKEALSMYESAKGSVKFPFDQSMPYALISKIVKFRVQENLARTAKPKQKYPQPELKLEDIPNIGKSIASDLRSLGIAGPQQLAQRDPLRTYLALADNMGRRHDPCVLYTLMAARHYLENGETLPWWKFTEQGKVLLATLPKNILLDAAPD
jgi:uncharacterized protein YdhG (YjbR/CyaY superfamily)